MIRPTIRLLTTLTVLGAGLVSSHAAERTFFAFDDHSIPFQHNLKLTLQQAQKHPGNPVLRRGPEGTPDHGHAILYGTVVKEGDTFRMWYLAMIQSSLANRSQAPGHWRPMCYAESKDGVNWTKPELGLVELNGNTRNNICLIEGEPHSLTRVNDFLSVLHEPEDPDPSRRYKAVFIAHVPYGDIRGGMSDVGNKESRIGALIAATSADGKRWKVVGDRPRNSGGERFEVTGLYRFGEFYYTPGQLIEPFAWRADGSPAGRVMVMYRTSDFENWSQAKAFSFARPGQLTRPMMRGQQTHMGAGLWNRGNVLVGLYGMWDNDVAVDGPITPGKALPSWGINNARIDLGLVVSNDGVHFREPVTDFKIIPRGQEGEWDSIALLQGHAFVNDGDRTMIWYSHWDTSGKLRNMEIGLATLRRDGFGFLSLQSERNDGHFITAPLTARVGSRLRLNVTGATSSQPLSVELLDTRDRPIPGYSGAEAARITSDSVAGDVVWTRGAGLPEERPFAVRVNFTKGGSARVYAVYVD